MKPLLAFTALLMLAAPAAAADPAQCEKRRAEHDAAFRVAILHAAGSIDKKARCVAARDAIAILDKMVETTDSCPAEPGVKDMVSRRKATHVRNCGA